jgi:hypothetical protein
VTHWESGKPWSPYVTAPLLYLVITWGQGHACDGWAACEMAHLLQKYHTALPPSGRGSHSWALHPQVSKSSQTDLLLRHWMLKLSSHSCNYWLDTKTAAQSVPHHHLSPEVVYVSACECETGFLILNFIVWNREFSRIPNLPLKHILFIGTFSIIISTIQSLLPSSRTLKYEKEAKCKYHVNWNSLKWLELNVSKQLVNLK